MHAVNTECLYSFVGRKAHVSRPPPCLHDQPRHDAVNGKKNLIFCISCTSPLIYRKVVELFFLFPHSLCTLSVIPQTFSLSDRCYICHCVWSDPLPDLHQSRSSYEHQPNHTEPRTTDGEDHRSHHQPGGHPHTGRGVRSCGAMAHCVR